MMFSKLSHRTNLPYTPAGRLCNKLQGYTGTGNIYAYSPNNKQHAIRRIYNGITNELSNLRWDNNGNLAQQTVYSVNNNVPTYQTMRMLFWDEDDRLNLVAGDGYLSYYAYGYDGNRAIKMTGNAAIDQSGTLLNSTNLENITIYPNEYLTVTQAEYTKYYYAGGNRIASKIGTGGFEKMTRLCTLDQGPTYNANNLLNFVLYQVTNISNHPTDEFPVDVCGGYSVATELLTNQLPTLYITQTSLNFTQNNLLQQFRQNLTNSVEPVYYFHSDHLGSASWITDGSGLPVQHLQYLPFGEHFVNEHSSGYDERFTFTGKERDAETGYYYHGARFNTSDWGWLSVDPQFENLPSITPYNYCLWNPIVLYDPDGEREWPYGWIDFKKRQCGWSHYAPQRELGYSRLYDNLMNIPFNLHATEFSLEELGVTVRLWKGDYGKLRSLPLGINLIVPSITSLILYETIGLSGGEIGLYNSNKYLQVFGAINNKQIINERIDASMTKSDIERIGLIGTDLRIYNKKNNELIASRSENASFWTTAFSLTNSEKPDELYTVNTFTFKDEKSANKFYNSLNKHSGGAKSYYHNHQESIKIHRNRNKVIIIWGYE